MKANDYDDPATEERWCSAQREQVADYLERENVAHGAIGEWPAWHLAPYVSIWAVESLNAPGQVGWWAISGDLPTDYVSSDGIKHPRQAMRSIASRWTDLSESMERGEQHPEAIIGTPAVWPELAPLLRARAGLLAQFADDDSLWDN